MVPLNVLTLIASAAPAPSILVMEPVEERISPDTARVVPIYIGVMEAFNLGLALESTHVSRPTTHDLMLDAITHLDALVDHVLINDEREDVFYAQLTLSQHGRLIVLDARPSDAIALAIRQDAPIFIEEDVLDRASYPFVFKQQHNEEEAMEEFRAFLESVSPDDFLDE